MGKLLASCKDQEIQVNLRLTIADDRYDPLEQRFSTGPKVSNNWNFSLRLARCVNGITLFLSLAKRMDASARFPFLCTTLTYLWPPPLSERSPSPAWLDPIAACC